MSFSRLYQHVVEEGKETYVWSQVSDIPFTELILSWNGFRPVSGFLRFSARVFVDEWLPWIDIADWGCSQRSFGSQSTPHYHLDVDVLKLTGKQEGSHIEIKVEQFDTKMHLDHLWVSVSNPSKLPALTPPSLPSCVINEIKGFSQLAVNHPKNRNFCSATSVHTALNYFDLNKYTIGEIAEKGFDPVSNMYGHWPFNMAAAYEASGCALPCAVHRLENFDALLKTVSKGIPVIVSVKGKISGAPKIYEEGHLMTVIGWDHFQKKVLCLDSAFRDPSNVKVAYDWQDFMNAWRDRFQLCYQFFPASLYLK